MTTIVYPDRWQQLFLAAFDHVSLFFLDKSFYGI